MFLLIFGDSHGRKKKGREEESRFGFFQEEFKEEI